jgi:PST family polysaccharide transporter
VAFLGRDLLGPWLGAPTMGRFMGGFVLASAMESIAIVPEKTLARDLRFRQIALTRGIGELLFTVLALSFVSSLGGFALVLGAVGRSALIMTVFLAASDRQWLRPVRMSWPTSLAMFRYSSPLALANMTDFATMRWDNLLIGKFHGAGVMGAYNLSYNLSQTSTLSIAENIADVLFPSFARLEPRHRGQALVRAVSAMALVVFPLAFGLAAVAANVVGAFFPPQWALIAPMLTVLSVHSAAQPPSWTFRAFYKAQDRTTFVMIAGIVRLTVLLTGIVAIGRFGPLWACVAVDIAFVTHFVLMWSGLRRNHAGLMWPTARGVIQALLACVPMVASVLVVQGIERHLFPLPPVWALCLEIPAGVVGYVIGAALFARETSMDLLGLLMRLLKPGRDQSGQASAVST